MEDFDNNITIVFEDGTEITVCEGQDVFLTKTIGVAVMRYIMSINQSHGWEV